jgi:hypothetical protein
MVMEERTWPTASQSAAPASMTTVILTGSSAAGSATSLKMAGEPSAHIELYLLTGMIDFTDQEILSRTDNF